MGRTQIDSLISQVYKEKTFLIILSVLDVMFGSELENHNENGVSYTGLTNLTFTLCKLCKNVFIAITTSSLNYTDKILIYIFFIILSNLMYLV